VQGLTIRHGSATEVGGIRIGSCAATIRDCRILENTATSGGGICLERVRQMHIDHCVLAGNMADRGGGLLVTDAWGTVWVESCVVTGNLCTDYPGGAGICAGVMGSEDVSHMNISGSTIAGNRSLGWGGGITVAPMTGAYVHVDFSIIWGNCAAVEGDEVFAGDRIGVDCCCLDTSGVSGLETYPPFYWITTDPFFCDPEDCLNAPTTEGAYTLDAASPCLPQNNPWEMGLYGALGQGCDVVTSVASGPLGDPIGRLFSVSPIPSTGLSIVRYDLPSTTVSSLAVFDIAGRLVRVLDASGTSGASIWDGKDGAGRDAGPGVYFVRVTARDYTDTRRIILVR
jgi:hypothetical protein